MKNGRIFSFAAYVVLSATPALRQNQAQAVRIDAAAMLNSGALSTAPQTFKAK